jgi:hypothetical protein
MRRKIPKPRLRDFVLSHGVDGLWHWSPLENRRKAYASGICMQLVSCDSVRRPVLEPWPTCMECAVLARAMRP